MIRLNFKKQNDNGSIFYRYQLDDKLVFWFSLYNSRNIYSIRASDNELLPTSRLFPTSHIELFLYTDNCEPYYFDKVVISGSCLRGTVDEVEKYIEEVKLAQSIAREIEDFFRNRFLQEEVDT